MGRTAGTPNKITAVIREKLSNLIDSTVNSIDISSLTVDQRIKLIQIACTVYIASPTNSRSNSSGGRPVGGYTDKCIGA